ncbi:MAG: hypothetical protein ACTSWW_11295 [Promethearchaeota archaeon]
MFLQDPAWEVGNYEWSEAFIWIAAVMGLIFGFYLFASYIYTRKKHILLWAFAFLGMWVLYHQMIANGYYLALVGSFETSFFGMPSALLVLLIPGLLAAGLAYDKDEKFGTIFTWALSVLTVVYLLMLAEPNTGLMADPTLSTKIAIFIRLGVQLISAGLIIFLVVMKESKMGPKTMMGVGGVFLFISNLLYGLLALVTPGTAFVDFVNKFYPFFLIFTVVCLVWGIIGNKDWGFTLPNIEFEE